MIPDTITVPGTVTVVGQFAFDGCGFQTAGPIGNNYDFEFEWTGNIPAYTFEGCRKLSSVVFPEGMTYIGFSTFRNCVDLTTMEIPAGITSI